jgi:wyosine [tRNA(Phe)-imidazoG37] synthetase (radical SAM superfamily)
MKKLKTICFQTRGGVNHDFGGLDRVTELLADFFEASGYTVYYLSQLKRPGTHATRQIYLPNQNELTSKENIRFYNTFIKKNKIDVLINQEGNVNIIIPLNEINKDLHYQPTKFKN